MRESNMPTPPKWGNIKCAQESGSRPIRIGGDPFVDANVSRTREQASDYAEVDQTLGADVRSALSSCARDPISSLR
jgi:hypothetical protein